jgi:hypothetical protein
LRLQDTGTRGRWAGDALTHFLASYLKPVASSL